MRIVVPSFVSMCLLFLLGCSRSRVDLTVDDLQERFDKGMAYLEKKKYYRAQEQFQYVLLHGRHTEIGDEAQFYLAESYFFNKEYLLAISEYDRLVRQMSYSPFAQKSRYRICQSYVKKSPKYFHDQDYTKKAIEKLQEFIEDYPDSEYREEAMKAIASLRSKLARKTYESGILYVKMEEYEAAIRYFDDLLANYYDTEYADKARVGIVQAHVKAGELSEAENYLNQNGQKFVDEEALEEARSLIGERGSISKGGKDS